MVIFTLINLLTDYKFRNKWSLVKLEHRIKITASPLLHLSNSNHLDNSDPYSIQTAKPLKDFIGYRIDDSYKTDEMQDSEEFINYLVSGCSILNTLTNFSADITYECRTCKSYSTITDNMNIRYENVNANSIYDILTSEENNCPPVLKRCDNCQKDKSHFEIEANYELPDVLIISLQRFEQNGETITKDCQEVMPSPVLPTLL